MKPPKQHDIVVVTGASKGLGKAVAEGLIENGWNICAIDIEKPDLKSAYNFDCDVTDIDSLRFISEYLLENELIPKGLVNFAGITKDSENIFEKSQSWEKVISVNLGGSYNASLVFGKIMSNYNTGSIVNISSIGGHLGFPNNPSYLASKGAILQLTKSFAYDFSKFNIRVNSISPGYFNTPMNNKSWNDKEKRNDRSKHTLLNRWGNPHEMVGPVQFLISDQSSYITGADIVVDGGWLAKGLIL